jgi:hypothetical protein
MYRQLEHSSSPSAVTSSLIFTKVSGPMCLVRFRVCLCVTLALSEPFCLLCVSVSVWMLCVCP